MNHSFKNSFLSLKSYCESQDFAGWDPYDGLNSKVFQATPLKHWDFARLAWIQGFKRSPINFRRLLLVPKGYNAKGIALFLSGYCNLYQLAEKGITDFGTKEELVEKINYLAELLISLQSEGYSGACWGYNFDWQNRVFFQPINTPTVVATTYCASALFDAYETIKNANYKEVALSASKFILYDLSRSYLDANEEQFIFSYSPLDNSRVYNASLLGAKLLAKTYHYTHNQELKDLAYKACKTIVNKQNKDGFWIYGEAKVQNWIDSFHTGFNLESISEISQLLDNQDFSLNFDKGLDYYLKNFFENDGTPKYFHNKTYPIDVHCPAQLLITLSKTKAMSSNKKLAELVLEWTIKHMQNKKGYFYYQLKKGVSSQISYMRWAQAWMFLGFTEYFKATRNENLD